MPWSPSLAPHWLFSHAYQLLPSMFSTSCINWTFRFSLSMLHTPLLWSPWTVSFWNSTHLSGYTSKTLLNKVIHNSPNCVANTLFGCCFYFWLALVSFYFWQCSWIPWGMLVTPCQNHPQPVLNFFLYIHYFLLGFEMGSSLNNRCTHTHTTEGSQISLTAQKGVEKIQLLCL